MARKSKLSNLSKRVEISPARSMEAEMKAQLITAVLQTVRREGWDDEVRITDYH